MAMHAATVSNSNNDNRLPLEVDVTGHLDLLYSEIPEIRHRVR
jgi:hypothetical protein